MRILTISLLLFIFAGCGTLWYTPLAERKQACMEKFIKLDVDGIDAAKMCETAFDKN
jgi:hypothetical protein